MIQTDASAVHGNSGGPGVDDSGSVVGVMTFISLRGDAEVQGFNFLIPAKDVRAFLAGTAVKPGESRFNPVWAAGVTALLSQRYSLALAKFREADGLLPDLVVIKRSMREAEYRLAHPPTRPFPWAWTTAGALALLSVSTWGVWAVRRWKRNWHRVHPGQVVDFLESGLNFVLLDVRVPVDYATSPLSIPKAIRLDPEHITEGHIDLPIEKNQLIVTFCTSPEERSSTEVARLLGRQGWSNVRVPQGRTRRVGERPSARGEQIAPPRDRDRDLPEPHARGYRTAPLRLPARSSSRRATTRTERRTSFTRARSRS